MHTSSLTRQNKICLLHTLLQTVMQTFLYFFLSFVKQDKLLSLYLLTRAII